MVNRKPLAGNKGHQAPCWSVLGGWGRQTALPLGRAGVCLPFCYAWPSRKHWDSPVSEWQPQTSEAESPSLRHNRTIFCCTFLLLMLLLTASGGHCDTWLNVLGKKQSPKGCRLFWCNFSLLAATAWQKSSVEGYLSKWVKASPWT